MTDLVTWFWNHILLPPVLAFCAMVWLEVSGLTLLPTEGSILGVLIGIGPVAAAVVAYWTLQAMRRDQVLRDAPQLVFLRSNVQIGDDLTATGAFHPPSLLLANAGLGPAIDVRARYSNMKLVVVEQDGFEWLPGGLPLTVDLEDSEVWVSMIPADPTHVAQAIYPEFPGFAAAQLVRGILDRGRETVADAGQLEMLRRAMLLLLKGEPKPFSARVSVSGHAAVTCRDRRGVASKRPQVFSFVAVGRLEIKLRLSAPPGKPKARATFTGEFQPLHPESP